MIVVEHGEIQLSFKKRPYKQKSIVLSEGDFFAGQDVVDDNKLRHYSAQVDSNLARVFSLPWDLFIDELDLLSSGREVFQSRLKAHMLEQRAKVESEGVIQ